jgi:hypothetical protein
MMKEQSTTSVGAVKESVEFREARYLQEDIAALAYTLWQSRGCPHGTPDEDWFNAEEILKASGGMESMCQESRGTFYSQVTLQQPDVSLAEIDDDQTVEGVREVSIDIERHKLAPQL